MTNEKLWYAVVENSEDNDWGYGSYDFSEAKAKAEDMGAEAYIVVIREGNDPIAVDEIKRGSWEWNK